MQWFLWRGYSVIIVIIVQCIFIGDMDPVDSHACQHGLMCTPLRPTLSGDNLYREGDK